MSNNNELNILFQKSVKNAQLVPQESVPQNLQLVLYGLYKQATSDVSSIRLGFFHTPSDLRDAFKLNAWFQVKHLSVSEAKKKYIAIMNDLLKERGLL